jgi:UDP-N-acetylmuramoylalanine--D-glutamate ligase
MLKALVIGVGISGKSAISFLLQRGYLVHPVDSNLKGEYEGIAIQKDDREILPFDFSLVVVSPGISRTHILCLQAKKMGIPVIGEAELALQFLENHPAVAITGTNGKTTVTLLVSHVLKSVGKKATSAGNVGFALTSAVNYLEKEEIVVAELSSYQLETMKEVVFSGGVILNITPDHLDRYEMIDNYAEVKLSLFSCLKEGAPLYLHQDIIDQFPSLIPDQKQCFPFGPHLTIHPWMDFEILVLVERLKHMLVLPTGVENILAGFLLTKLFGVRVDEYLVALKTFKRPAHRMESIATIQGVEFCNDSKATNVDSVSFALNMVKKPLILIMGGRSKGSSYKPLISKMDGLVKEILTIGEAAEEIEKAFDGIIPSFRAKTLANAVSMARNKASAGDMVLLSPGCSSYDQFKNYEDRGNQFRNLIKELEYESKRHHPCSCAD